MKKNIVHVIPKLLSGGVEISAINLLANSFGINYKLVVIHRSDSKLFSDLPVELKSKIVFCNGYFDALIKLRKIAPNILVSSLWKSHIVTTLYSTFFDCERVHFVHSASYRHFLDTFFSRVSLLHADRVIADSKESLDFVGRSNAGEVVNMTLSFCNEHPKNYEGKLHFVYFGRLHKVKDLKSSLLFISCLKKRGHSVTFDIYGRDDGDLKAIEKAILSLNLTEEVSIKGEVKYNEVETIMRRYTFLLQTSLSEGMGISVYQAVKAGLIPVVTPVGEISNYCINRKNSLYFDSNNIELTTECFLKYYKNGFNGFSIGYLSKEYRSSFSDTFFQSLKVER